MISAMAVVPSNPKRVYAAIADYHNGDPNIVPKEFSNNKPRWLSSTSETPCNWDRPESSV